MRFVGHGGVGRGCDGMRYGHTELDWRELGEFVSTTSAYELVQDTVSWFQKIIRPFYF